MARQPNATASPPPPQNSQHLRRYPLPPDLPSELSDWQRQAKINRTLNDLVEELHRGLLSIEGDAKERERYKRLLYAVYDEQAVEGSLSADNTLAAMMIRDRAIKKESKVAKELLATISKALGVVLRRYNESRTQRRNMVGGQIVPSENNE